MSEQARDRIFSRLKAANRQPLTKGPQAAAMPVKSFSRREKIDNLKKLMEAMRTEVHVADAANWLDKLAAVLKVRNIKTLLFGPQTAIGKSLQTHFQETGVDLPELIPYDQEVEHLKETVFKADAGITSTYGAIADTGALILWSSAEEPRQMSLVPPIHIAVLKADKIYNTFVEVMQQENWAGGMPTNAFLISGPSKTADIELTLAFGVHGPKELIVLVVKN
ncbi:MAG: lactate utilization protein [Deltaproteobacteria bacterium]|nr:lactate utilization protein [Deltaproteobacteria bacterium]